jgi:TrmH family RNA methyltransferase
MDTVSGLPLLDSVVFVLDRPREPANVGAVVRLLGNFGISRLRLVEPAAFDEQRVLRYARRGLAVAAGAKRFPTLQLAVADCAVVLGTTRRERALERPVLSPREVPGALLSLLKPAANNPTELTAPAAILFGPEDFGLSNQAIDLCHAIVNVPAMPDDASLNLAQAAAIVAYEIYVAAVSGTPAPPAGFMAAGAATHGVAVASELEPMFDAVSRLLVALHDPPVEGRTKVTMSRLRAFFLRAVPRGDEAQLLTTIFEHAAREILRRKA